LLVAVAYNKCYRGHLISVRFGPI